ncbi:MAG: hypothetical protein ACRDNF_01680 [Streptosporangiaceae bacterium]
MISAVEVVSWFWLRAASQFAPARGAARDRSVSDTGITRTTVTPQPV